MKYIYPLSASAGVQWDQPLVDCEDDFDERPPTPAELAFLKAQAEREEEYENQTSVRG